MIKSIKVSFFAFFVLFSLVATSQNTIVQFRANMNHQIEQGKFNPTNETVDLAGSFNNWGGSLTAMSDADQDGIYTVSLTFPVGTILEFKTRINGAWNGREEFAGGGANRSYMVAAGGVVEYWYNDEFPDYLLNIAISASSTFATPGKSIQFTDLSSGNPTAWHWTFEGAQPTTSSTQHPLVTYANEGSFDVSLLIVNAEGDSLEKTFPDFIKVGNTETFWWNEAVFYEIFVRSFKDSDGDGKGDFKGLIDKLDYLNDGNPATNTDLGINGIWLMPVQESPSYHGYDATDYKKIESDYGSNQDFKDFIAACHERGIKVIVDFVMNHSSTQHPWFVESANAGSAKRDWFVWRSSNPGGSGPWGQQVWHSRNNAFYYGVFWSGMPDLNYNTPAVKQEMFETATFWLEEMQVDGFRLDAVKYIYEEGSALEDTPQTIQFWKDFRAHYKSVNPSSFSVGEAWTSTEKIKPYVNDNALDYCFEFDLANAMLNAVNSGNGTGLQAQMDKVMNAYPFLQFGTFLSNHDINRVMDLLGNSVSKSKLAASLLLSLPGIPYLYYGEEIGMNGSKPDEEIRTPLHWNSTAHGGFTTGTPWRALKPDFATKNIANQQADANSLWHHYRQWIDLRNSNAALQKGTYQLTSVDHAAAFAFLRQHEAEHLLVVSNLNEGQLNTVSVSAPLAGINAGDYFWVDLLGGRQYPITIAGDGGFVNLNLENIQGRTTHVYKLLKADQLTKEVLFEVDMSAMIEFNVFDPSTETLTMVADFNSMGSGTLIELKDEDGDKIYSITLSNKQVGQLVQYKYRINQSDDGRQEFPNSSYLRTYQVKDGENSVLDKYNNELILNVKKNESEELKVFPVPANQEIIIQLPAGSDTNYSVRLIDANGKVSTIRNSQLSKNGNNLLVNVQQVKAGMYVLELKNNQETKRVKIVIEH